MLDRKLLCGMVLGAVSMSAIWSLNSSTTLAAPTKPREQPASTADSPEKASEKASDTAFAAGSQAVERGEYELALKSFEEADRIRPDQPETLNMLGYSQRKLGQLDQARESYLKALSIRPGFAQAREYLGENYLMLALREMRALGEQKDKAVIERKMLAEAFGRYAKQADEMAK